MKIGLVRRGFSATGGAEAYMRRFAEAAKAAGHDVVLFTTSEWSMKEWKHEVFWSPGKTPLQFADELVKTKPHEHCDFLLSLERVWECDAFRAGDGVHASWLARRAESEPGLRTFFRKFSRKHRELLQLENALLRDGGAKQVIANSQMVKREIIQHFKYPEEKTHVIYNGLTAVAAPPEARKFARLNLEIREDEMLLIFVGSGSIRKGIANAIEAVKRSKTKPPMIFAGVQKIRKMLPNERIFQFPKIRSDLVPSYLSAADAFILPTLYDPFSNACLEAMAAGLPVITTAHNGFAEIMEPGVDGEVIADGRDVAALADAIDRWADMGRLREARPRLQEKAKRFSIEENLRSTLAIIQKSREAGSAA